MVVVVINGQGGGVVVVTKGQGGTVVVVASGQGLKKWHILRSADSFMIRMSNVVRILALSVKTLSISSIEPWCCWAWGYCCGGGGGGGRGGGRRGWRHRGRRRSDKLLRRYIAFIIYCGLPKSEKMH